MEGSIVNQIEISGFSDKKESEKLQKKLKSLKSVFNLYKIDKSLHFVAEEASYKLKEDNSLIFLFLTEDSTPEEEINIFATLYPVYDIKYLLIVPSGSGLVKYKHYSKGKLLEIKEVEGALSHMLGDLIKGGFQ